MFRSIPFRPQEVFIHEKEGKASPHNHLEPILKQYNNNIIIIIINVQKGVKITLIYTVTYKLHCQENILAIKYWGAKKSPTVDVQSTKLRSIVNLVSYKWNFVRGLLSCKF